MSHPEKSILYISLPQRTFDEMSESMEQQAPGYDLATLSRVSPSAAYDVLAIALADVSPLGHQFNHEDPADDTLRQSLLPPIIDGPTEVQLRLIRPSERAEGARLVPAAAAIFLSFVVSPSRNAV